MKIKKKKRRYNIGSVCITDVASVVLNNDEQITLMEKNYNFQYDICKKSWGYYATPSLNSRLKKNNLSSYIVKSKKNNKIFIHLVKKSKKKSYLLYLKSQNMEIINWPKKIIKLMNFN
jgi:hypothetical protein